MLVFMQLCVCIIELEPAKPKHQRLPVDLVCSVLSQGLGRVPGQWLHLGRLG